MPPVQPYNCPFCEAEMLFDRWKNSYTCPDCKTIVELGDRPLGYAAILSTAFIALILLLAYLFGAFG